MDTDPNTLDPSTAAHLAGKGVGFPELATREFRAFHNGLRILVNMDIVELIQVGVLFDGRETDRFIKDPFRFLIRASAEKQAAIWRALQARQPADLRAEPVPDIPLVAELLDQTERRRRSNAPLARAFEAEAVSVLEDGL